MNSWDIPANNLMIILQSKKKFTKSWEFYNNNNSNKCGKAYDITVTVGEFYNLISSNAWLIHDTVCVLKLQIECVNKKFDSFSMHG